MGNVEIRFGGRPCVPAKDVETNHGDFGFGNGDGHALPPNGNGYGAGQGSGGGMEYGPGFGDGAYDTQVMTEAENAEYYGEDSRLLRSILATQPRRRQWKPNAARDLHPRDR